MEPAGAAQDAPLCVVVVGAAGRLGRHACRLLERTPGFQLVDRLGRGECSLQRLAAGGAQLGLDCTAAGLGAQHGQWMLEAGLRPVIGTSGVSLEENAELDSAALELGLGGLVVPNFSVGMWLLQRAACDAARIFARAEIIESHHSDKLDAPSSSALESAAGMRRAQHKGQIPIHSLRLPGVLANQEVVLSGPGEVLRLVHETYSLEVYSQGILLALRFAAEARGVGRGLALVLESGDAADSRGAGA